MGSNTQNGGGRVAAFIFMHNFWAVSAVTLQFQEFFLNVIFNAFALLGFNSRRGMILHQ